MEILFLLHQAGLINYAMRKSKQIDRNPCLIMRAGTRKKNSDRKNDNVEPISFKLVDFGGAFFILVSVSSYVGEILLNKIASRR